MVHGILSPFFLDSIFDDVPNHATVVHKKEVHI